MYDYDIHEAIYQYRQYEINVTWFRGSGPGAGPIIMATVKMLKNISQSSKINLKQRYDVHNVFFLNCENHLPQDNGSGFLLFFAKKWVTYAHIVNVVFCWVVFFFGHLSHSGILLLTLVHIHPSHFYEWMFANNKSRGDIQRSLGSGFRLQN